MALMTHFKVDAMLKKEKEKAFVTSVCLVLKPPHLVEVAANPILQDILSRSSRGFVAEGNTWEHFVSFLDSIGPFAHL